MKTDIEIKFLEIRDRGTFIGVMAIELQPRSMVMAELYILAKAGYGVQLAPESQYILYTHLERGIAYVDPYEWGDRTNQTAHSYIRDHWASLKSGDVIDVEYILGETTVPKKTEAYW